MENTGAKKPGAGSVIAPLLVLGFVAVVGVSAAVLPDWMKAHEAEKRAAALVGIRDTNKQMEEAVDRLRRSAAIITMPKEELMQRMAIEDEILRSRAVASIMGNR